MENNSLLAGIVKDAEAEAEKIRLHARGQMEQRRGVLEGQIRKLIEESDKLLAQAQRNARRRTLSVIRAEERKIALKTQEALGLRVIQEAEALLAGLAERPEYGEVLSRWIAEGALGVNRPKVIIRSSSRENLTDRVLRRAEALVLEASGRKVELIVGEGEPLADQGVVMTSPDGRISFSNQVSPRLRRYAQEVNRIINEALKL